MFETETKAAATWYRFNENVLPGDKSLQVNPVITRGILKRCAEDQRLYRHRLDLLRQLAANNRSIMNALDLPDDLASNARAVANSVFGLRYRSVAAWRQLALLYDHRNNFLFQLRSLRCPFREPILGGTLNLPWDEPSTN
jgi:hypothetical protein